LSDHVVNFLWSKVSFRFNEALAQIQRCAADFEAEARLAHDIAASKHRDIVEQSLAVITINPKIPASIFSVPFNRNEKFLGRSEPLAQLYDSLSDSKISQKSCLIHGIGGVGKTQLALEFSYRYRQYFRYIFWLRAQDSPGMVESFCKVAQLLRLIDGMNADQPKAVDAARRWLCDSQTSFTLHVGPY
jgi:hypothetical protein